MDSLNKIYSLMERIDGNFRRYVNDTRGVLNESQESKSISAAKNLVMDRLGYDEQQADEFVRIKLRNDLKSLKSKQGGKFILGVTRMFLDHQLTNASDIIDLDKTIELIATDAHINEYDRNLNGLSAQELIQKFATVRSNNLEKEKEAVNKLVFDTPSDYEIVRIDSFEQSAKYGQYTEWCVTHGVEAYNSYTANGINQFYFCLRGGFENEQKVVGEGCPLDSYGLSMIAVSVTPDGSIHTCTCRWNHANGGTDGIMNAEELSKLLRVNFFNVFKPNNKWKNAVEDAMRRLANGEKPRNIFDKAERYESGFIMVKLCGRWNFIGSDGKLLSPNQWFDLVCDFHDGFAVVGIDGKGWNYLNLDGKLLSNEWFDDARVFNNGFAMVKIKDKGWNYLKPDGKLLCPNLWFDYVCGFYNGLAKVHINGKGWNYLNLDGELISF